MPRLRPRNTRCARWLLACIAALLQAACGGGGGSGASSESSPSNAAGAPGAAAQADYAPLNTGDRWVYRREDGTLEQQTVGGPRTVQGRAATVLTTTDVATGSVDETLFIKTGSAITELPDSNDAVGVQIGDVTTLQLPLRQGQSFVQVDKSLAQGYDVDGDRRPDAMTIRSDVTVVGFESVAAAVGSFSQCAHLRTVLTVTATASSSGSRVTVTSMVDEWYAPGLGLVRDSNVTDAAGRRTTTTRELVAYAVAGSKSDSRAPALTGSSPAAGAATRGLDPLTLRFDKAIDGATLRNGGLTLAGPAGQNIPFTLRLDSAGTTVTVQPSTALGAGRHTVRLGPGVQDLIGNALPNQDWAFTVDRSAPTVASSLPAAGAVDVPLDATVRLQFDEALDPATITTDSVRLLDRGFIAVPVRLQMPDARSVLITPLQPLAAGRRHAVELAPSVADVLGNSVFNTITATSFETVQGRFSAPAKVAGAAGGGLAGGDVNGDGRTDLLTILDNAADGAAAFNLYLQNAAGGFDAPRRVDTPARSGCHGAAPALLVDMNGDGRADIVTARGSCGVEVVYQSAGGAFDRSVLLAGSGFTMLKVADMNGDGRPDVVATAWGSETVSVWLQRGDGSWGPQALYPLFNNGYCDLAVGDLNGDGRLDIAVTSGQGDLQRALGIVYQQADSSFGPPQYRPLGGGYGPSALTIADVDGDGRADLLAHPAGSDLFQFRQQPGGTLAAPVAMPGSGDAWQLVVADIDGDGRNDILTGAGGFNGNAVALQLQRADGSFASPVVFRGIAASSGGLAMVVADFNGDGLPDVALHGAAVLRNLGVAGPQGAAGASALLRPTGISAWRKAAAAAMPPGPAGSR